MNSVFLDKIRNFNNTSSYFIIDSNLRKHYSGLFNLIDSPKYFVEGGEQCKTLKVFEECVDFLIEHEIHRYSQIIAIGGGTVNDLSGFIASTILRGIEWISIPTTVLSTIDASIGGKVGINTKYGKNLVGNFHNPKEIIVEPEFLKSLNDYEVSNGHGELLKYAFLDKDIFNALNKKSDIFTIYKMCMDYKKKITTEDFKENGLRKILNLGHTFGHAFEKKNNTSHGLSVARGIEVILQLFTPGLLSDYSSLIAKLKIDKYIDSLTARDFDNIFNYIAKDKKRSDNDKIDIIIPRDIGEIEIKTLSLSELENMVVKTWN